MSGPSDLFDAAQELLSACAEALTTTSGGGIAIQIISPGLPSFDCAPALYVHAGGPSVGGTYPLQPPLQPMQRMVYQMVDLVQYTVTVIRCIPVIGQTQQSIALPQAAAITAASEPIYEDVWAIWNHCKNLHRAGLLFQSASGRREFEFQPAIPLRTSGGVAGWEIPMTVQLGGYNEVLGS
jgi:hypothetical protein